MLPGVFLSPRDGRMSRRSEAKHRDDKRHQNPASQAEARSFLIQFKATGVRICGSEDHRTSLRRFFAAKRSAIQSKQGVCLSVCRGVARGWVDGEAHRELFCPAAPGSPKHTNRKMPTAAPFRPLAIRILRACGFKFGSRSEERRVG